MLSKIYHTSNEGKDREIGGIFQGFENPLLTKIITALVQSGATAKIGQREQLDMMMVSKNVL